MSRDVAQFVKHYDVCQMNKARIRPKEPMAIIERHQSVTIDTIGPFPKTTQVNIYAVTKQCEQTK